MRAVHIMGRSNPSFTYLDLGLSVYGARHRGEHAMARPMDRRPWRGAGLRRTRPTPREERRAGTPALRNLRKGRRTMALRRGRLPFEVAPPGETAPSEVRARSAGSATAAADRGARREAKPLLLLLATLAIEQLICALP